MEEIKNKKILIVDDEAELLKMTAAALRREGFFNVLTAENCKKALEIIKSTHVSLAVLDVMLPDGDGFSLFEKIRYIAPIPAIFLTARGEGADKIQGLLLGADDYIVKPFLMKELVLRITAVLKRVYAKESEIKGFYLGEKYISIEEALVRDGEKEKYFTAKELILLKKLYANKGKVVTNDALCLAAWGDGYYGYENSLMVHIRRIREKIEKEPSKPYHLITVKGIGYKLIAGENDG